MEIFTDTEKCILESTKKDLKWIARDKDGELHLYAKKPVRNEDAGLFDTVGEDCFACDRCFSSILFSQVTWENSPIQYRNNKLLTPKEREYLKFVFKPFASDIMYVQKMQLDAVEYIGAITYYKDGFDDSMIFPCFKKGIMYKGMKPEVKYTLKELGIVYNE